MRFHGSFSGAHIGRHGQSSGTLRAESPFTFPAMGVRGEDKETLLAG